MVTGEYSEDEKELLKLIGVQFYKKCYMDPCQPISLNDDSEEKVLCLFSTIGRLYELSSSSDDAKRLKTKAEEKGVHYFITRDSILDFLVLMNRKIPELNTEDTKELIKDFINKIGYNTRLASIHEEFLRQFTENEIKKLKDIHKYLLFEDIHDNQDLIKIIKSYCFEIEYPSSEELMKKTVLDGVLRKIKEETFRLNFKNHISEYFVDVPEPIQISSNVENEAPSRTSEERKSFKFIKNTPLTWKKTSKTKTTKSKGRASRCSIM